VNKIFSGVNRFYKKYCFFFDTARQNVVVFGGLVASVNAANSAGFTNLDRTKLSKPWF
jgi:hypothetical protein